MMNENMRENCRRSFSTRADGCNFCDSYLREYPCTMPACIRYKVPDCKTMAVIPAVTLDTTDGIKNLSNCFVHVTSINTTYYVDDKGRIMIIWAGPVEVESYDIETNPLKLRAQTCYTTISGVYTEVWFDKQAVGHIMSKEE